MYNTARKLLTTIAAALLAILATSGLWAADTQLYGVTFELAANGVFNDFSYAVGDNMAGGYWYWDMELERRCWHPNVSSYNGVADGEPYGWFVSHYYNGVDYSDSEDESQIVARSDAAGGQALQLNTDAGTLTNKLQKSVADEITAAIVDGGCAYIETEVKFVPNDTLDAGIAGGYGGFRSAKSAGNTRLIFYRSGATLFLPFCSTSPLFAIYAFIDEEVEPPATHLVIFHGVMDANGGITYTNEVFTSAPIDASYYTALRYTKLRIEMRQLEDPLNPGAKYNAFSVSVDDGAPLSSVTALDARFGGTATGTWFMTVEDRSLQAVQFASSLNFRGTGEIDNIKVGLVEGAAPPPYTPVPEEPVDPAPDTGLDYNRCHDGAQYDAMYATYGWQQVSGSNYVAQAPNGWTWTASGVGLGTTQRNTGGAIDETVGMTYPTLYFQNLPPSEMPSIRSPKLTGGVGTIDFRSILLGTTVRTSELTLQVAYTDNEPAEVDWIDVEVYGYGMENGNMFSRINHVVLNDYGVTYVRILRTGFNSYNPDDVTSGRLAVDNICITKPPADVGIVEKLRNPGYPAADQDILMRCAVTNCVETTPATNRHVSVKYQYVARDTSQPVADAAAWSSAVMVYKGKDESGLDWYEGTIPAQPVGYVWYYYQVDYDGYAWSGTLEPNGATVSESISPAYWDAGTNTHVRPVAGAKFQVRPYRSRYGCVEMQSTPAEASVSEMTLVGDEQWQTVVGVDGINAVSSTFVGYGYYEDDAAAYEDAPVVWGENNQGRISVPPFAGFLESSHDTTVTNGIVVRNEEDYSGFYMYRFHSNDKDVGQRYDYIVKKAVYQDFDDWTASPDYYEASLGGLPTFTYAEDFDGNAYSAPSGAICTTNAWTQDEYDPDNDIKLEDFLEEELSDAFSDDDVTTRHGFIRTGSRVIADRKTRASESIVNKTLALQPHGKIQNTGDAMPSGLEKVTFKARASVDDKNFALYKGGTAWTLPLAISATWLLTEKASSKPYFSYVFLCKPEIWSYSYYELRIIQTDSTNNNSDNTPILIELWRHTSDGTETRVGNTRTLTGYDLRVMRTMNVYVDNNSGKLRVRIHTNTGNPTSIQSNTTANSAFIEDASPINTDGGTIGFGVFDAVPKITRLVVGTGFSGSSPTGTEGRIASISASRTNWYDGGIRPDGQPRWTITDSSISRPVPQQTIGIYAVDCVGGANRADAFPSTPVATRTVNSFAMTDYTLDFKAWNKNFVQIRHDAGDGDIVLDDLCYYPWRAVTRCDIGAADLDGEGYREWTSAQQQNEWLDSDLGNGDQMSNHWAVLEGWVADSGPFRFGANFERSRANTNLVQGVVSPVLQNGIGSISFSYEASGGKVVYGVERTDNGDCHSWTPVAVFTNYPSDSGERFAKIGKYFGGRIRVRIYGAQDVGDLLTKNPDCGYDPAWGYTAADAKLLIDNLRAKDYPEDVDDTAWHAYNALITGDAPDGLIYGNSGKSCFLNNSPTDGTYGVEAFDEDDPYLESPSLRGVGIGEIALQYRIVPGSAAAGVDGHLVIKAAPSRDTPLAEWTTITNLVVSAAGTAFVKFEDETILNQTNFVVRFYNSKEPGTPRIVIDNVLVAAPAHPSNVAVTLYDPEGNEITDEDVLDWIARYGAEQSDIDALGAMDKFNGEFLLNLDLTKECVAELKITSIRIKDGLVYLGVQLTRTENNVAVGIRKTNGTLKLLGRGSLSSGVFAPLEDADVGDQCFEFGNTTGVEYELPASSPPEFFKVKVEMP